MPAPKGTLTGAQLEILKVVWSYDDRGGTIGEIWQQLCAARPVARTTVQTMIVRLQKRGWLLRDSTNGVHRYKATCDHAEAARRLATDFVDEYFDGSAAELVMSLLGPHEITPEELEQIRQLLGRAREDKK